MNILVIYPRLPWSVGYYCERSLRKKHHVEVFDLSQTINYETTFRLRNFWRETKGVDVFAALKQCKKEPDVIIEIDGSGSHHLKGYKKVKIPKAYWAIDSHVKLGFQKRIARDFDYVFVAQKDFLNSFKGIADNVYWLPLAADPDVHKKFEVNKLFDIGYVGKTLSVEQLVRISRALSLIPGPFSRAWKGIWERTRLIRILGRKYNMLATGDVYAENLAKVYGLSKMGFNKSIAGDLNMRVFEVMSCGTMLLTDKIENGISSLFKHKEHLVMYSTEEELNELIKYYLENEDERETIARQGQKEIHDKHTYDHRMGEMLSIIR